MYFTTFSTGCVRLLPGFINFGYGQSPRSDLAVRGYGNPEVFIESLVSLKSQLDWPNFRWHEISLYISLPGLFLILYLAVL